MSNINIGSHNSNGKKSNNISFRGSNIGHGNTINNITNNYRTKEPNLGYYFKEDGNRGKKASKDYWQLLY